MRSKGQARKLTSQSGDSDIENINNESVELNSEANKSVESEYLADDDDNFELDLEDEFDDNDDDDDSNVDDTLMKQNRRFVMETKMSPGGGTIVPSSFFLLDPSIIPAELYLGQSQCPATTHPEVNSLHGLGLGLTLGVWTKVRIPSGTHFGPFVGKIRSAPFDKHFAWQIGQISDVNGTCSMWVDSSEPGIGNWMKFVRTSYVLSLRNMKAVLLNGQIYYKVTRDIKEGEELLLKDRKVFEAGDGRNQETSNVSSSNPITRTLLSNGTLNNRSTEAKSPPSSTSSNGDNKHHPITNDNSNNNNNNNDHDNKTNTKTENNNTISAKNLTGGHFGHLNRSDQNNRGEEDEDELEEDLEEEEEEEEEEPEVDDDDDDEEEEEDRLSTTTPRSSQDSRSGGGGGHHSHVRHFSVIGSDSNEAESKDEVLECAACSQTFNDVEKLEEHLVVVHCARDTGLGEYKCGLCPKIFSWKSNLLRHQSTHEDGRRYNCENCHKIFTDPSNLQRHIRSQHIGARSHACPECGKTFATSSGLKQHTHIHSSVKPFQCEVCLKSYTQFSNLCRHKRMHADCRMQIKCHKCGQAFATVTSLSKHKRFCEGTGSDNHHHHQRDHRHHRQLSNGCANLLPINDNSVEVNSHPTQQSQPISGSTNHHQQQQHQQQSSMNLSHQLMFYPRPGFPFYPPSMVAYPMFPAGAAGASLHPQHPALIPGSSLFMPSPTLQAKKPDSPDSSVQAATTTTTSTANTVTTDNKKQTTNKEKRISEASESDASDISSIGVSDDIDVSTDSEVDSIESDNGDETVRSRKVGSKKLRGDQQSTMNNNLLFVPRREHSPKQGAVYPVGHESNQDQKVTANGLGKSMSASGTDMPFDLSVGSKVLVRNSNQSDSNIQGNGKTGDDQPLDLRVTRKRKSSPSVHLALDLLHKSHVFGEQREKEIKPIIEKLHENNNHHQHHQHRQHHNHQHQMLMMASPPTMPPPPPHPPVTNFIGEQPPSPNKFPMAYPRPIHPLMMEALYRMEQNKPKFTAFHHSPDRVVSSLPAFPVRYPFLNPLMNLNNQNHQNNNTGNNGGSGNTAFDMLRNQMEKMTKPYHDVLSPHMNKIKERYSCKFCGKIFPRSANLTRHLRTHTGEQPYKCKYCERSFSISSNLQRHVRNIHNKEKPFKCPLCDRCFGQQTNLDRHLKKHESDGPTILDDGETSPKNGELLNDKDDTYFDEIRNFIGKVTDQPGSVGICNARPPSYLMGTSGYDNRLTITSNHHHMRERDIEPIVPRHIMELDEEDDDDVDVDAEDDPPIKPRIEKDDIDSETSSRRGEDIDDITDDLARRPAEQVKLKVRTETEDDLNVTDDGENDNDNLSENITTRRRRSFQEVSQRDKQTAET